MTVTLYVPSRNLFVHAYSNLEKNILLFFYIYLRVYYFFFTGDTRHIENKNKPSGYVKLGGVIPLHDFRSSGKEPLRPKCGIASPEDNGEPMEMN